MEDEKTIKEMVEGRRAKNYRLRGMNEVLSDIQNYANRQFEKFVENEDKKSDGKAEAYTDIQIYIQILKKKHDIKPWDI